MRMPQAHGPARWGMGCVSAVRVSARALQTKVSSRARARIAFTACARIARCLAAVHGVHASLGHHHPESRVSALSSWSGCSWHVQACMHLCHTRHDRTGGPKEIQPQPQPQPDTSNLACSNQCRASARTRTWCPMRPNPTRQTGRMPERFLLAQPATRSVEPCVRRCSGARCWDHNDCIWCGASRRAGAIMRHHAPSCHHAIWRMHHAAPLGHCAARPCRPPVRAAPPRLLPPTLSRLMRVTPPPHDVARASSASWVVQLGVDVAAQQQHQRLHAVRPGQAGGELRSCA